MIGVLGKDPIIALCEYRPPDAFQVSVDFLPNCRTHVQRLCAVLKPELAEMETIVSGGAAIQKVESLKKNFWMETIVLGKMTIGT
jgi:hypothetical protein